MDKLTMIRIITLLLLASVFLGCNTVKKAADQFQHDADQLRLEHLLYWSGLIEEYNKLKGEYPFQSTLKDKDAIGLIKIATREQREYLSPGTSKYRKDLDNNIGQQFSEKTMADFVSELENALGKPIVERYDIQKVPTRSPIGYNYFYTADGYLIWVTCITCGVTPISTLLYDGYTPTVNIVSGGMKGKVTKALLRTEMENHPIYKKWKERGFLKEDYVRGVEKSFQNDSKQ